MSDPERPSSDGTILQKYRKRKSQFCSPGVSSPVEFLGARGRSLRFHSAFGPAFPSHQRALKTFCYFAYRRNPLYQYGGCVMTDRLLVTASTIAVQLNCKKRHVHTLRKRGELSTIKIAGVFLYPRDAASQYIQDNMVKKCPEKTPAPSCLSTNTVVASTTTVGQKKAVVTNEARSRTILRKLKSHSKTILTESVKKTIPLNQANPLPPQEST